LTTKKHAFKAAPAVRGHDDQITASAPGRLQNAFRHVAFDVQRPALDVQFLRKPIN
jgi:hypothetical protein